MEGWAGISLSGVAANGNLKQLYPTWAPIGAVLPATVGQLTRYPRGGKLYGAQVKTDGTNGGIIELWDVNARDIGVDVSSSDVITDAELTTLISMGLAKLMWSQNFTSSAGATTPWVMGMGFLHGLAARYVQTALGATCSLNLDVEGGFDLVGNAG